MPLGGMAGALILAGLDAVAPDPAGLLDHVGAHCVVSLQTDAEIERRFPEYLGWLRHPEPYEAVRAPIEDHLVIDDRDMASLIRAIMRRLTRGEGVVVHCGAGWGRAGLTGALVLVALGSGRDSALDRIRSARPAASPQSAEQFDQFDRLIPILHAERRTTPEEEARRRAGKRESGAERRGVTRRSV